MNSALACCNVDIDVNKTEYELNLDSIVYQPGNLNASITNKFLVLLPIL